MGMRNSNVCRGLRASMIVINKAGVATTTSCVTSVSLAISLKLCGCGSGKAHEESNQQDQHAAKHRAGHGRRILTIVHQLPEPEADVQPFAFAEQAPISELNCSTAQRIASRQHAKVAMITGGP